MNNFKFYNYQNQLTQFNPDGESSDSTFYTYNLMGQRVQKNSIQLDINRKFVYDANGQILCEYDAKNDDVLLRTNIWAGGAATFIANSETDIFYYTFSDAAGSIYNIFDANADVISKYDYTSFGEPYQWLPSESIENPFTFHSSFFDPESSSYFDNENNFNPHINQIYGCLNDCLPINNLVYNIPPSIPSPPIDPGSEQPLEEECSCIIDACQIFIGEPFIMKSTQTNSKGNEISMDVFYYNFSYNLEFSPETTGDNFFKCTVKPYALIDMVLYQTKGGFDYWFVKYSKENKKHEWIKVGPDLSDESVNSFREFYRRMRMSRGLEENILDLWRWESGIELKVNPYDISSSSQDWKFGLPKGNLYYKIDLYVEFRLFLFDDPACDNPPNIVGFTCKTVIVRQNKSEWVVESNVCNSLSFSGGGINTSEERGMNYEFNWDWGRF